MKDKTSQKTEEEMLDQTFVEYNEEMTVETEDDAKEGGEAKVQTKTKMNQNYLVYGAMGIAAIGFIAYTFMPSNTPEQQTQTQMPMQQPVAVTQPVVAVTTDPVQLPFDESQLNTPQLPSANNDQTQALDPVSQFTGGSTNTITTTTTSETNGVNVTNAGVNDGSPAVKVETSTHVTPESTTVTTTEVKNPSVEPVATVVPAVTQAKVTVEDNSVTASSNERLLSQFQDMLDRKYDPKFEKIETALNEQKDFNKSIADRLARLEEGKTTKVVVTKASVSRDEAPKDEKRFATHKTVKRVIRKPIVIRHQEKTVIDNSINFEGEEVLINKTFKKAKVEKVDAQKTEPVYPKIEIHSVYSGRIWTKNLDGTLSTFAVGDKLPTGEIIKKIDEDKEKITTDKRVISQ